MSDGSVTTSYHAAKAPATPTLPRDPAGGARTARPGRRRRVVLRPRRPRGRHGRAHRRHRARQGHGVPAVPHQDALIGAYLRRLARNILAAIDADIARHRDDPAAAIRAIFAAIGQDLARPEFRGCAFNNASIEFSDSNHPARRAARDYRAELQRRLTDLARAARPDAGPELGAQLAVLVDGMYTSAAHLGPNGPAATGPALAEVLLREHH